MNKNDTQQPVKRPDSNWNLQEEMEQIRLGEWEDQSNTLQTRIYVNLDPIQYVHYVK